MKNCLLIVMLILLSGCNLVEETSAIKENLTQQKIWANIQFNVPEEGNKIDSYYYYAEVSESLYQKISKNELQRGFILLENVKYWDSEDELIHEYGDAEQTGTLVFRIEDIRRFKLLRKEPR